LAQGNIFDRAVGRIVVGAHALPGEVDHDLIELAAGRSDVDILDGLGHVDDLHVGHFVFLVVVDLQHRQDQIDRQRGRAGHAAPGDVAVEHRVEPVGELEAFARQDVVDAVGETGPCMSDLVRLGGRDFATFEADDSVIGEVATEQADAMGPIGLVGQPDEAVGAHAEQLGAVVVAMLDPQAEPRGSPAHRTAGNVQFVLFCPLLDFLQRRLAFLCQSHRALLSPKTNGYQLVGQRLGRI